MARLRVIFAGGGTGGHLFPAIAVADALRRLEPQAEILFVGTSRKIEARVVPQRGYAFRTIWISGFHRSLRPANLLFPLKVIVALMQARSIISSFKPQVVVGTGGYVAGPVLRAAAALGVPTVVQEQNGYPGVTTRVLARKAAEVHVTFESSKRYFARTDNLFVTGNPTRADLAGADRAESLKFFGLDPRDPRPVILAFGGSLGAHAINAAVGANLAALAALPVRIIWQTGAGELAVANAAAGAIPHGTVSVNAFIDRMDFAYGASDLVLCRAGATTIAELTLLGKPAILVPYPHAAAHHQEANAAAMAEAGAAVVLTDENVGGRLVDEARIARDPEKLGAMGERCRTLGKPGAAAEIARRIVALAAR